MNPKNTVKADSETVQMRPSRNIVQYLSVRAKPADVIKPINQFSELVYETFEDFAAGCFVSVSYELVHAAVGESLSDC